MADAGSAAEPDARFRAALADGRLELQRCSQCLRWTWPAALQCTSCSSWDLEWRPVAIAGTVFTWTRTHHDFPGTEGLVKPFVTMVVTINDTPLQLMGLLEGPSEAITIGAPVTGRIIVDSRINNGNNQGSAVFRWQMAAEVQSEPGGG